MNDLISRQDFDKFLEDAEKEAVKNRKYVFASALNTIRGNLKIFPSAQPEPNYDEWCHDCKEYDQEQHCCPRWNMVIREALKDAQPEIIRCKDCKHWTQSTGKMTGYGLGRCDFHDADLVACNGFCYWAERRNDE